MLEGSKIRKKVVKSYGNNLKIGERKNLLTKKSSIQDDYFVLQENIEFSSSSYVSSFCLGNSSDGWNDWKNKDGKTMNETLKDNEKII